MTTLPPIFPSSLNSPTRLAWPVQRNSALSSTRQKAVSGRRALQPLWPSNEYNYVLKFNLLSQAAAYQDWQTLEGFYNQVMTTPNAYFQYPDANDNAVVLQPNGTGDGVTASFQLVRTLGGFTAPVLMPLSNPSVPSAVVRYGNYQGGTTTGPNYGNYQGLTTVGPQYGYYSTMQVYLSSNGPEPWIVAPWSFANNSPLGGVVNINPPPAVGQNIAWTGGYNFICQFDEDVLKLSNFMYLYWEAKTLPFTAVREL